MSSDMICIGSNVFLKDDNGEFFHYTIVSDQDADPMKDLISSSSRIGSALLGKTVGDEVSFSVHSGTRTIRIILIEEQDESMRKDMP